MAFDLERYVRRLEDIENIRALRFRYHDYLNRSLFDRMSSLYTDDAVVQIDYVARAEGIEAVHAFFVNIPKTLDFIKQFIHNHLVEIDGDMATGIAYMDARYAAAGESVIVAGRFDEKYRRTDEGWRIAETLVTLYFSVPLRLGWASSNLHCIAPHADVLDGHSPLL
ncbi:nuclear transport factor 2 family protein [Sphingomonas sp. YL-JM2C]